MDAENYKGRKVHTSEATTSDFHHVAGFISAARAVRIILQ